MVDDEVIEEEVSYVMMDFGGILEGEFESKMDKPCKILGMDTETPYLDIGGSVFKGEFEDAPDTYVFFEADGTKTIDTQGSCDNMKYVCHTSKKLNLAHSLLNEKSDTPAPTQQEHPLPGFALHATEDGEDALDVPEKSCPPMAYLKPSTGPG